MSSFLKNENIIATTAQLFQYAQDHDKDDPATKELLRYRTGRVLNILYLIQEELLNLPILYLGRHPHAGRTHHRTVAHAPDRPAVAACSVVTHSGAPPRACCARFEREPTSEGRPARGHDARGGRPPACAGWHIACMRCAHEYDDRNESHRVRVRRSHAAGELDLPILQPVV